MATLQDILRHRPELATGIDAMTELIPGVPASKENLKTLLECLTKRSGFDSGGTDETSILFLMPKHMKKKRIEVQVLGKAEVVRWEHGVFSEGLVFAFRCWSARKTDYWKRFYTPSRIGNDTEKRDHVPTVIFLVSLHVRS